MHGVTKANYYYRLRKVREACLGVINQAEPTNFIELHSSNSVSEINQCMSESNDALKNTVAVLHGKNEVGVDICEDISLVLLSSIIEALANVK